VNDATQKDQDLFLSASMDNQTTAAFHNSVRYGLTRKREQYYLWSAERNAADVRFNMGIRPTTAYVVTITGARTAMPSSGAVRFSIIHALRLSVRAQAINLSRIATS
jgi:hypothetical protein